MHPLIEQERETLVKLCRCFGVNRLEIFGSATGPRFRPESSDFDFLVDFAPVPDLILAERYFRLHETLEALFGRPVDLVRTSAIKDPDFLRDIEPSRTLLFTAARDPA